MSFEFFRILIDFWDSQPRFCQMLIEMGAFHGMKFPSISSLSFRISKGPKFRSLAFVMKVYVRLPPVPVSILGRYSQRQK